MIRVSNRKIGNRKSKFWTIPKIYSDSSEPTGYDGKKNFLIFFEIWPFLKNGRKFHKYYDHAERTMKWPEKTFDGSDMDSTWAI